MALVLAVRGLSIDALGQAAEPCLDVLRPPADLAAADADRRGAAVLADQAIERGTALVAAEPSTSLAVSSMGAGRVLVMAVHPV
jgi:hypothetical protein